METRPSEAGFTAVPDSEPEKEDDMEVDEHDSSSSSSASSESSSESDEEEVSVSKLTQMAGVASVSSYVSFVRIVDDDPASSSHLLHRRRNLRQYPQPIVQPEELKLKLKPTYHILRSLQSYLPVLLVYVARPWLIR